MTAISLHPAAKCHQDGNWINSQLQRAISGRQEIRAHTRVACRACKPPSFVSGGGSYSCSAEEGAEWMAPLEGVFKQGAKCRATCPADKVVSCKGKELRGAGKVKHHGIQERSWKKRKNWELSKFHQVRELIFYKKKRQGFLVRKFQDLLFCHKSQFWHKFVFFFLIGWIFCFRSNCHDKNGNFGKNRILMLNFWYVNKSFAFWLKTRIILQIIFW